MSLTSNDSAALEQLACFFLQHERWTAAGRILEGLAAARPDDPYPMYGLAFIAERRGDLRQAAEFYAACCARSKRPEYLLSHGTCLLRLRLTAQAATVLRGVDSTAPPPIRRRARALLRGLDGLLH